MQYLNTKSTPFAVSYNHSESDLSGHSDGSNSPKDIEAVNPLKGLQTKVAQTRRQQIVANRRKNFQEKKKTELCKNYVLGTPCPLGTRCSFAHGEEELKPKPFNNYKTVRCRHFHERGFCQYGPRCQFLHNDRKGQVREVKPQYTQLLRFMNDTFLLKMNGSNGEDHVEFNETLIDFRKSCVGKLAVFQHIRGDEADCREAVTTTNERFSWE